MENSYKILLLGVTFWACAGQANAQFTDDEIIVTGTSVSQGGAQDIKHFRGQAERGEIPSPAGMTSEGLLSEHDLYLVSEKNCEDILCLNAEAMSASIINSDYFAGLSFDTNMTENWSREPLNLVAVIDRSGSMKGKSITNVKRSLHKILDNLQEGDQVSFILYGSDVVTHLDPLPINKKNKKLITTKIDSIIVEGSTNMDKGLARGYEIAHQTQPTFDGNTRVMIFTDERPNTGRTDADGFMARAKAASRDGIGLTTIGYGVDYGGALAAKIASVRGGNLFYVASEDDVDTLFKDEFDFMVSELAHDLTVTLTPASGLKVKEVYGVAEHMITKAPNGAITMEIPTVFFSSKGGGLFVSLNGTQSDHTLNLFSTELQYKEGQLRKFASLTGGLNIDPQPNLKKAEALSAQYTAMKTAVNTYYDSTDPNTAFDIFNRFTEKFNAQKIDGLEQEYDLVSKLNERLALEADRLDDLADPPNYAQLHGLWEVARAKNMLDVKAGDRMLFTKNRMEHFRKNVSLERPDDTERYMANDKQIYLTQSDLTFRYTVSKKGRLILRHNDEKTVIYLNPVAIGGSG